MFAQRLFRPVRLGVQSLKLHKLRSLLTVLGVIFGVSSVIVMLAVPCTVTSARSAPVTSRGSLGGVRGLPG